MLTVYTGGPKTNLQYFIRVNNLSINPKHSTQAM